MEPRAPTATVSRTAFGFVFATVLLDTLAMGVTLPVLPKLVEQLLPGQPALAARVFGAFGTSWALMQFLGAPLLGVLSDRFGRRPVLLVSSLGLGVDYVVMALAPSVGLLFVGRVLSGLTSASLTAANAYVADTTPPARRAERFGLIGVAMGVGLVAGPALGGVLGHLALRLPFWAAAALSLTNTVYGLLALPESLPREARAPLSLRRANPVGALLFLGRSAKLAPLTLVFFLCRLAYVSTPTLFALYTSARYGWSERSVGFGAAFLGVSVVIVQLLVLRPFLARLGERAALIGGVLAGAVGFSVFAWAPAGALFLLGVPCQALFWVLFGTAIQSRMTILVTASEQGALQGAKNSVVGVAEMIGPVLFSAVFAESLSRSGHLGAAFGMAAAVLGVATGLAVRATQETQGP